MTPELVPSTMMSRTHHGQTETHCHWCKGTAVVRFWENGAVSYTCRAHAVINETKWLWWSR